MKENLRIKKFKIKQMYLYLPSHTYKEENEIAGGLEGGGKERERSGD